MALLPWLRERIWPLEWHHTENSMAASVRLALLEMLSGGVTCITRAPSASPKIAYDVTARARRDA